jgi:hypothetical protein
MGKVLRVYGTETGLVVKTGETLYRGALLMLDANREVIAGTLAIGNLQYMGRARTTVESSAAGHTIEIDRGDFHWILAGADSMDMGKPVYCVDDQTVTFTQAATEIVLGYVVGFDSTGVYVQPVI